MASALLELLPEWFVDDERCRKISRLNSAAISKSFVLLPSPWRVQRGFPYLPIPPSSYRAILHLSLVFS